MGEKHPFHEKSTDIDIPDSSLWIGFAPFFTLFENQGKDPWISYLMQHTIGWEFDIIKKYPYHGTVIGTDSPDSSDRICFSVFSHTMGNLSLSHKMEPNIFFLCFLETFFCQCLQAASCCVRVINNHHLDLLTRFVQIFRGSNEFKIYVTISSHFCAR